MDEYSGSGIFDTDLFIHTKKQLDAARGMVPQHFKPLPKPEERTCEIEVEQRAFRAIRPTHEVALITSHLARRKSHSASLEELSHWPFPVFTLTGNAESGPLKAQQNGHAGKREHSGAPNSKTQPTLLRPSHGVAGSVSATHNRQEMIVNGLPLVRAIARSIAFEFPLRMDLGDLIQSGTLALKSAVGKYDPQKAASFSTYVKSRIRGAMLDSLSAFDSTFRVGPLTRSNLHRNPGLRLSLAAGPA